MATWSLYLRRDSPVHRLHPVTKVLFLAVVFVAGLLVTHPLPTLVLGVYVAAGVWLARAWRGFAALWPIWATLFVVTALIWTWAYPGEGPGVMLGPIRVPLRGASFGLAMSLRLVVFFAAGLLVLATTRVEAVASALRSLGLPYTVGFVLTLAFRLLPLFVGTARTVIEAQAARGYELERGTPWARLMRRGRLIVPIFLSGLRNADGMALALEARGFAPGPPRGAPRDGAGAARPGRHADLEAHPPGRLDILTGVSLLMILVIVVALRAAGLGIL